MLAIILIVPLCVASFSSVSFYDFLFTFGVNSFALVCVAVIFFVFTQFGLLEVGFFFLKILFIYF